jgi:hypothetical protein
MTMTITSLLQPSCNSITMKGASNFVLFYVLWNRACIGCAAEHPEAEDILYLSCFTSYEKELASAALLSTQKQKIFYLEASNGSCVRLWWPLQGIVLLCPYQRQRRTMKRIIIVLLSQLLASWWMVTSFDWLSTLVKVWLLHSYVHVVSNQTCLYFIHVYENINDTPKRQSPHTYATAQASSRAVRLVLSFIRQDEGYDSDEVLGSDPVVSYRSTIL